jgi:hypothetical protein
MFFKFAQRLSHRTCEPIVAWEAELAVSCVMTEAFESGTALQLQELTPAALAVLECRGLSQKLLAQSRKELRFFARRNGGALGHMLRQLPVRNKNREQFRARLIPHRAKILAFVRSDEIFADHIKLQGRKVSPGG